MKLESGIELARLQLLPETVEAASRAASWLALGAALCGAAALLALGEYSLALLGAAVAVAGAYAVRQIVRGYPSVLARKRANALLRQCPEATNLMIMSLRRSPSMSRAIEFASRRPTDVSYELRKCVWDVLMGTQASIEDSLLAFGRRMEAYGPEIKVSMNALVAASREGTEAGVRRALDRASRAIVVGAKHRIEEYALSLSTPSMLLFGLGILLPLMIGSFLPMLSWDLWSSSPNLEIVRVGSETRGITETAVVMDVLFPAIALAIALGAAARHPMERAVSTHPMHLSRLSKEVALVAVLAGSGIYASFLAFDGLARAATILMAAVVPAALALLLRGRTSSSPRASEEGSEDVLFKIGARMLDGGNFQCSLSGASCELEDDSSRMMRSLSTRYNALGQDFGSAAEAERMGGAGSNVLDGLVVVHDAATKEESSAGILAMDIAAYLRDMRDIDRTLRTRLRPIASMMKATSHFLGPVVLGITFALYVSLTAIAGGGAAGFLASAFFLILGAFLAETNAVVVYFVSRMERGGRSALLQLGECLLVSESIYVTTALAAS
jgi:hypothetical protein